MNRLIEKGVLSGAVLVARGEKVLLARAAGEADKRFHVLNNVDTKVNLGSMDKMFTAVTIAIAVNPEARLKRLARQRGWPIEMFY